MRYEIPQFIEHDTKLIGPVTIKQFLRLFLVGVGLLALYPILKGIGGMAFFVVVATLVIITTVAVLFITFNGRPLSATIMPMLRFYVFSHQYIWRKKVTTGEKIQYTTDKPPVVLNEASIRQFARVLNDKIAPPTKPTSPEGADKVPVATGDNAPPPPQSTDDFLAPPPPVQTQQQQPPKKTV